MKTVVINSQDLGAVGSIDTYQTFTSEDYEDQAIDCYNQKHNTQYDYDDFDWDYDHPAIVAELARYRAKALERDSDAIKSCQVKATYSPKYYNYQTDSADFEIVFDDKKVDDYILEHKSEYEEFLSMSGWRITISANTKEDLTDLAKLDFYLNKTMYDYPEGPIYAILEEATEIYWEHTTYKPKIDKK